MRSGKFRQHADDHIHVFDIVNHRAVWMPEAIVNPRAVVVHLSFGDDFRFIALVLPVRLAQDSDQPLLLCQLRRILRQAGFNEVVEAPKLL